MRKLSFDEFNALQEETIKEFNMNYKEILSELGKENIGYFLHENITKLRSNKLYFEVVQNLIGDCNIEIQKSFLKNYYLMIMAFKLGYYFNPDNINLYSMDNNYDMKIFLKDSEKELELFRFSYDETSSENVLNLVFYDDEVSDYDIKMKEEEIVYYDRQFSDHNSEVRTTYLFNSFVKPDYTIHSTTVLEDSLDSRFEKYYSDNKFSNLLTKRKAIIRNALMNLNCYDAYVYHFKGKVDETGKKLLKSYPYINVYNKIRK